MSIPGADRRGRSGFLTPLKIDERLENVLIARQKSGEFGAEALAIPVFERGQGGQNAGARRAGVGAAMEIIMDQFRDPAEPLTHLGKSRVALRPASLGQCASRLRSNR